MLSRNTFLTLLIIMALTGEKTALASISAPARRFVHAASGVVLRSSAAPGGAKIATLPYGAEVELLASGSSGQAHVAERVGPFQLSGKWLNVKTAEGKTGFVFECYVLPYPPQVALDDQLYFEWFYQQIAPQVGIKLEKTDSSSFREGAVDGRTVVFNDGAEYEFALFEGGLTEYLRLPKGKMSMEAALVVFRSALFREEKDVTTAYDPELKAITVSGEVSALHIRYQGDVLEITLMST